MQVAHDDAALSREEPRAGEPPRTSGLRKEATATARAETHEDRDTKERKGGITCPSTHTDQALSINAARRGGSPTTSTGNKSGSRPEPRTKPKPGGSYKARSGR